MRHILATVIFSLAATLLFGIIPEGEGLFINGPNPALTAGFQEEIADTGFTCLYLNMGTVHDLQPFTATFSRRVTLYFVVTAPRWQDVENGVAGIVQSYAKWSKHAEQTGGKAGGLILSVDDVRGDPPTGPIEKIRKGIAGYGGSLGLSPGVKTDAADLFDFTLVRAEGFAYPWSLRPSLFDTFLDNPDYMEWRPGTPYLLSFNILPVAWSVQGSRATRIYFNPPLDTIINRPWAEWEHEPIALTHRGSFHQFLLKRDFSWNGTVLKKGEVLRAMIPSLTSIVNRYALESRIVDVPFRGAVFGPLPADPDLIGVYYESLIRLFMGKNRGPDLDVHLSRREGGYQLQLINRSPFPSDIDLEKSYVEWIATRGAFASVKMGSFDKIRYAYGREETTRGGADRLKLYSFYIAPNQIRQSGIIRIRGKLRGKIITHTYLPDGTQSEKTFMPSQIVQ